MAAFDPIDEKVVFEKLSNLINGMDCSKQSLEQHKEQQGVIYAKMGRVSNLLARIKGFALQIES